MAIGLLLGRTYFNFRRELAACLAERGLAEDIAIGMGPILFHLVEHDGCPMKEVVQRIGTGKATVTDQVRVMETRGLVVRGTDPADARVVRLHLTAKARRLLPQLARLRDDLEADIAMLLGDAYRPTVAALEVLAGFRHRPAKRTRPARRTPGV